MKSKVSNSQCARITDAVQPCTVFEVKLRLAALSVC